MSSVDATVYGPIRSLNRGELLLELLSEEIPARMQRRAIEDLKGTWVSGFRRIASEERSQSMGMSRRDGLR